MSTEVLCTWFNGEQKIGYNGGSKRQLEPINFVTDATLKDSTDDLAINFVTDATLKDSTEEITKLRMKVALCEEENTTQQKVINTLKAERQVTSLVTRLAFAFRLRLCSYIVDKPPLQVHTLELQLLELYVHDSQIFKDTPVETRWNEMCVFFRWNKDWNTDSEIPAVVTYIDENADERLFCYDIDHYDEYVKERRDELKQLPEDHCANKLLILWDMLMKKLDTPTEL